MCNVYCMYSYLILHLPILQLYKYTFMVFYVFMFAFVPLKKLWKRCPLSWPRPSFWLRCSSRCRTSHPSERRGGWRQCHQHHHHQWPSSSSTSLFHFHLSANSNSVGSDFREIVVMRSDSGKKWCLHHNRWVSEKQQIIKNYFLSTVPRLATWLHFWQPGSCFSSFHSHFNFDNKNTSFPLYQDMIVKMLLCHFDKIFKFVSQNDVLSHTDHLCLHFVTCSKGRWPNWPEIHKWPRISNFFPPNF